MVGFGPEDDHFVAELTYNYGVGEYTLGNDFQVRNKGFIIIHHSDLIVNYMLIIHIFDFLFYQGLTLQSSQAVRNAKRLGWPLTEVEEAVYRTEAPGGYPFYLVDRELPPRGESGGCPFNPATESSSPRMRLGWAS